MGQEATPTAVPTRRVPEDGGESRVAPGMLLGAALWLNGATLREVVEATRGRDEWASVVAEVLAEREPSTPLKVLMPSLVHDATPVVALGLSVRAANCLRRGDMQTLGAVARASCDDLLELNHLGRRSLVEIVARCVEAALEVCTSAEDDHRPDAGRPGDGTSPRAEQPLSWKDELERALLGKRRAEVEGAEARARLAILKDALRVVGTWVAADAQPASLQLASDTAAPARVRDAAEDLAGYLVVGDDQAVLLAGWLAGLEDDRRRLIASMRLPTPPRRTLADLGLELGLTRERVRQLERGVRASLAAFCDTGDGYRVAAMARRVLRDHGPVDLRSRVLAARPSLSLAVEPGVSTVLDWLPTVEAAFNFDGDWVGTLPLAEVRGRTRAAVLAAVRGGVCKVNDAARTAVEQGVPPELASAWVDGLGWPTFAGRLLVGGASLADKALLVLVDRGGRASVDDLAVAVGGEPTSVRNQLADDPRFTRVDRRSFAVTGEGVEPYRGLREEIIRHVDRVGQVGLDDLVAWMTSRFDITAGSVRSYAAAPPLRLHSGVVTRAREATAGARASRPPQTAKRVFWIEDAWWARVDVNADHERGSGSPLTTPIAELLGVPPGQVRQLLAGPYPVRVNRVGPQPAVGTLRSLVAGLGLTVGDHLFLRPESQHPSMLVTRGTRSSNDPVDNLAALTGLPTAGTPQGVVMHAATAISLPRSAAPSLIAATYRARGDEDVAALVEAVAAGRPNVTPDAAPPSAKRSAPPSADLDDLLDAMGWKP